MPTNSSAWLPVSAQEWNVSASIAALPVNTALTPLRMARARLPRRAARTAVRDSSTAAARCIVRAAGAV
jgi:hypothetical protein